MLLRFLLIKIFFVPALCSLRCIEGPHCHIKLNFNQIIPTNKELLQKCSIIQVSSCAVYLKIDYQDRQVDISFRKASNDTESSYHFIDLLAANPYASIILRYAVKIRIHADYKTQLYVLLQCKTVDQCAERQLRHFWRRFILLNERLNSVLSFHRILFRTTSNVSSCFNDQTNQIEQCSGFNNICWASTDTERKCTKYNENYSNDFTYSYNKVERPHQLTDENVRYTLACHVNNCNNNETIDQLSKIAREFAETSQPTQKRSRDKNRNKKPSSFAIKLIGSYFIVFSFFIYFI